MFEDKTCLILGAGASQPYGFPTSGELRDLLLLNHNSTAVLKRLRFRDPDSVWHELNTELRECAGSESLVRIFRNRFEMCGRMSIDSWLKDLKYDGEKAEQNLEIRRIALLSIAAVLLRCEHNAEENRQLNGDWYQWLLEFILRRGRKFPGSILSIITFNYDRSLEEFLWRCFMYSFDLSNEEALEMLGRIEIVHVYGSLGKLHQSESNIVGFGSVGSRSTAAGGIRVAGPRTDAQGNVRIRELIAAAERLIFLGFGFWPENMDILHDAGGRTIWRDEELLRIEGPGAPVKLEPPAWFRKKVFASAYKLWRGTQIEVNARVGTILQRAGGDRPLINWGDVDQDIFQFVTHWNLKATA